MASAIDIITSKKDQMTKIMKLRNLMLSCFLAASIALAHAQQSIATSGAFVVVPAYGEVKQANDEARAVFMIEEQDKDKVAAASRVNQKMKRGMDIVHRQDQAASLKSRGYYSFPVYQEEQAIPRSASKARVPVSWRVGQYLEVITADLAGLPRTIAAAQTVLALQSLSFGLAPSTAKRLEEQRIAAAYANLTDRIAAIARAMGRNLSDAVLDTIDFEAPSVYISQQETTSAKAMHASASEAQQIEEPSFEPGETTLGLRVVGKVRFK